MVCSHIAGFVGNSWMPMALNGVLLVVNGDNHASR